MCTDHCVCGQHFHGLGAFDAHRREGYCKDASEALYSGRGERSGQPVLQSWTESGLCDKSPGCYADGKRLDYVYGVTIWQIRPSEKQATWLAKKKSEQGALL